MCVSSVFICCRNLHFRETRMIEKFFLAFIPVFVAIDPIGLVAVFIGLSAGASREERRGQALLGIFTALCLAVGFIFLGKIIFAALGITVADFQVAGAADRRAGVTNRIAYFGRHSRPVVHIALARLESRLGRDRVLECRLGHAFDGQTRVTRRIENSRATSRGDCREPDSPRLARRRDLISYCL